MNKLKDIFIRYLIIVLIALPNLFLFYYIFTPLTIYPLFGLFKVLFGNVSLTGNVFLIGNLSIEIIKACVAGSSYYLLFILNLSIPKTPLKKRLNMILFSFTFLLILNIMRIFILSLILVYFPQTPSLFDITHRLFWYFGATIFVVLVWFIQVKKFNIKEIPIYSDIRYLFNNIYESKRTQKN